MKVCALSQTDLDELARQIVLSFSPKKIILFGSYARGDFHAGSDLDLCIISNTDQDWFERSLSFKRKIHFKKIHVEAHIYTESEWECLLKEENSFAVRIVQEGKLLYEQK